MSHTRKWTTDELLEVLSYIESHPSDSLPRTCEEAIKYLNIDRTRKSVYSKVTKLTRAIKLWLNYNIKGGESIIWEDDRVYKLLENIHKSKETMQTEQEQEQELQRDDHGSNQQIESTSEISSMIDKSEEQDDLTDSLSDSTIDGDYYTDYLNLYRENKEQFPLFHLPLKILSDKVYEAEEGAKEIYEKTTAENEDINYYQICQMIKKIQEYRDEVCGLFEEFEKKINKINSL
ncbi:hypothetical protein RclHR1_08280013 [Rhizophagus clarus]|uniref:Uncharacterized protein n=1 Tax=Rhizophagus clarus TaxID=94130 RepID=A0A2Z6SBH4_9GLOM|nr:hypothetical protein RclHR1_08280013 [Rhizophagus clarus]GES79981.1 hypothetical protein GLOIN_2v1471659 [Rhizophagus clarus]